MTSCSIYQHYVDHEKQQKTCRLKCAETRDECGRTCINSCRNCKALSYIQASQRFKRYKSQQNVQGEIVNLELQSFKDPLQCRKTTCSCPDDYRVCLQSCQGKIHKGLRVAAAC
ncbi:MAG: hypothetical protein P1U74_05635 [Legionellaceae bacterium]|nr:hypothetical protein [Legionellaceae bacterium]